MPEQSPPSTRLADNPLIAPGLSVDQLPATIDAKEKPDYTAIAEDVDKAIGRLEAVPAQGADAKSDGGPPAKAEPGK